VIAKLAMEKLLISLV